MAIMQPISKSGLIAWPIMTAFADATSSVGGLEHGELAVLALLGDDAGVDEQGEIIHVIGLVVDLVKVIQYLTLSL